MNEKDFLFKFGLILTPAFFTSTSVEEAFLLAISFVILLTGVQGLSWLFRKVLPGFQGALEARHFREESLVFLTVVGLLALADNLARVYVYPEGFSRSVFSPVVLVNAVLLLQHESFRAKVKIALWFVFAVLILSVFKELAFHPVLASPFVGFLVIGFFLVLLEFFLRRRWLVL